MMYIKDMSAVGIRSMPSASGCGVKHTLHVGPPMGIPGGPIGYVLAKANLGFAQASLYVDCMSRAPKSAIIRVLALCATSAIYDGELSAYPTADEFMSAWLADEELLTQIQQLGESRVADVSRLGDVWVDMNSNEIKFTMSDETRVSLPLASGGAR